MANHYVFEATGTRWVVDILDESSISISLEKGIKNLISEKEQQLSRFVSNSLIRRLEQKQGSICVGLDIVEILRLYKQLYKISEGLFTPLIGSLLHDYGYDEEYSFAIKPLRNVMVFEDVITIIDNKTIKLQTKHVQLDFGAVAKGYIIDCLRQYLCSRACNNFTIDAGGDIFHQSSEKPLKIALENPLDTKKAIGIVPIQNQAIAGSSPNRRTWKHGHHILNPLSKQPVENVLATWVIAKNAMLADALATCLFFVKPDTLLKHIPFDYVLFKKDRIESSMRDIIFK